MENNEVTIIGGGLAGLTAAIHLSKIGINVTIFEKNTYPKHKVCGEYISNEVLKYLKSLDIDIELIHPTKISNLQFSTIDGKLIETRLPLGGFGLSRYILDEFLYKIAIANGCKFIFENVDNIEFKYDEFTISAVDNIIRSKIVIGAYGKRSNIDQKLDRKFVKIRSNWLAVKAHYLGDFNSSLVGLHNFDGGYCGVSNVENNIINICYLSDYDTFKKYKNIDDYQKEVLCQNPFLKNIFNNSKILFDKPLTISQISFEKKSAVEDHVIMIGDTAGLIHPLCGNGMAMAIHSAKIAAELIEKFCKNEIKSRAELEKKFQKQWDFNFKQRLKTGRLLSKILQKPKLSAILMRLLVLFPFIFHLIIKKTHGKPI
ncbi:MAG: NAD(P)/FAD-dependent oxidoreductase [Flavobacterium sp.]|nr:NAD(P)/FAD-dependent oxidoreductase [Flavobacterium sp.]